MNTAEVFIDDKLKQRQAAGIYRSLKPAAGLIDFCSNDYLGFAHSQVLWQMIETETAAYMPVLNGSTGSRLLTGNSAYAEQLEHDVAQLHGFKAGLIFNSGYDANLGLLSSLPQRGDTLVMDDLCHASLIDGARLSYASRYTFKHNDPDSLEAKLKLAKGICYVVIESVYSMDGDIPPLDAILALTQKYHAHLIVDEAHALGVFGYGLINKLKLQAGVFACVVTFGKAMGCHGAVVLGSAALRAFLINFARSFIYTTAAPFHQLAAIKMAYALLQQSQAQQSALHQHIQYFNQQMMASAHSLLPSVSAIHCVVVNSNALAKALAAKVCIGGLDVRAILSPTVAAGTERLRICLHTFNTREQIDRLVDLLRE